MSLESTTARDVDVRGFVYSLEPVRQRQQWRLDKLLANLAHAQRELQDTEAALAEVIRLHDTQAQMAGRALQARMDPAAHRGALAYLAGLRDQARHLDERLTAQRSACADLRSACVVQQMRIEGLAQHKADALTLYADEVRQRASVEQDRDWLSRTAQRRRSGTALP